MGKIAMLFQCPACKGSGVRTWVENNVPMEENPCSRCGGDGVKASVEGLDDTLLQEIFDKVKKIKKTVDDIWEKVNV